MNCFILFLLCVSLQLTAQTEKIRIMTYNLPYGNIKETDGNGMNTWENRVAQLHAYLNNVHPDLIGMQEPVRDELCSILKGIPGYAMVGWGRNNGVESGEYVPIVYRTDRFLVQEYGNYWLTDTPDQPSRIDGVGHNRMATWAVMIDKQTGARFLYTNTHLSFESEGAKFIQIKYLKTHMQELQKQFGMTTHLLTGDMNMKNTETDNYSYIKNYQLALRDVWTLTRNRKQLNSVVADKRIDYIFATKNVSCSYAEWGKSETDDGYIISDHDPLWADVYFTLSAQEEARAAVTQAEELIDSTYTIVQGRIKGLTSTSQLSTDGLDSNSLLSSVFDAKSTTYIQSLSSSAPNHPHYLQVKTRTPITDFRFSYQRRDGNTDGLEDRWQDVMITASNDGETWDYITELYNFGGTELKVYSSDNISLHRPYSYLRFSVMRTPGERLRNSHPQYSLSEFQLYANSKSPESLRYTSPTVDAACAALEEAVAQIREQMASSTITAADVEHLHAAIQALRSAKQDYADSIAPLPVEEDSWKESYDLLGRRVTSTHHGAVITGGKILWR